jgi:hypothetical protein
MKKVEITATTGKKGEANFKELKGEAKQYESLAEAIKDLKGEPPVLALINRQIKTDSLNALRKPSEASLGKLVNKLPKEGQEKIAEILKKYGIKQE